MTRTEAGAAITSILLVHDHRTKRNLGRWMLVINRGLIEHVPVERQTNQPDEAKQLAERILSMTFGLDSVTWGEPTQTGAFRAVL